jgi:toxin ParE1/3/4
MSSFRLSALARQDLLSIGRYTQTTWGLDQRNRYLAKLDEAFHLLTTTPQLGKACDEIRVGYRKYHIGRHLVFYRHSPEGLEVIRVLHERMDIESHLDED